MFEVAKQQKPLTVQLDEYARRIVNDRQSLNMLEVFVSQADELFARLAALLDRESQAIGSESISWSIMRQEHDALTDRIGSELSDFVSLLRTILRTAQDDERFLRRNRDAIASLFTEGELRVAFVESAQSSIDSESRFLKSLEFLEDASKRTRTLVHDLRMLAAALENEKSDHDKTLALLESCRMRAVKLHEQYQGISEHIPGLRDVDAKQARKLGMLSRSLRQLPV